MGGVVVGCPVSPTSEFFSRTPTVWPSILVCTKALARLSTTKISSESPGTPTSTGCGNSGFRSRIVDARPVLSIRIILPRSRGIVITNPWLSALFL